MSQTEQQAVAARALSLLDLTNLNDDCDEAAIEALCARAQTDFGPVAAVCIWPAFVAQAHSLLAGTGVRVATVVNFPSGVEPHSEVIEMTQKAVADGANDIDMVIPWPRMLEGHPEQVAPSVARVKSAAGPAIVKAILETGMLAEEDRIRTACRAALDGGADFLKTSTGKVPVNATPASARILLEEIAASKLPVGFKPAGGVRSTEDAAIYLDLADEIMGPNWATPETFRFGASSVLDALLATLRGEDGAESDSSGY